MKEKSTVLIQKLFGGIAALAIMVALAVVFLEALLGVPGENVPQVSMFLMIGALGVGLLSLGLERLAQRKIHEIRKQHAGRARKRSYTRY